MKVGIRLRIGIVTICDYENYGNRLQNYASQEVLKLLGCEVETIVNIPIKKVSKAKEGLVTRYKNKSAKEITVSIIRKLRNKKRKKYMNVKFARFKEFTKRNIIETKYTILEDNIPIQLDKEFDYFIVGSDQIWNPIFRKGTSFDFLTFAPEEKRIAYAPSFGISSIPKEFIESYRVWLSQIKYLSVREKAGAEIIKKLTGRDSIVLVDPTLMLTKDKWLSIAKPMENKPKEKYLLTYFLGGINKETKKLINKISNERNLKIVNLASLGDKKYYCVDPAEFIDLIHSSSIFFTDSFHGCVFSILLEKPFIVFEREGKTPSMNSRIETLLSKFQLESRKYNNSLDIKEMFKFDYSHVPNILESERKKTINYLKEALKIK